MTVRTRPRQSFCASASRREVLGGLAAAIALPACRASTDGFDADVLVLGAGLAGLNAAMWLAEDGRDVLVVEGSDRIGGRLHTLRHDGGGMTEAGGEQIGASYARLLDRVEQLGLETVPDNPAPRGTTHALGGRLYGPQDWRALNPAGFPDPFAGATPGSVMFRIAAQDNPFDDALDWMSAVDDPSLETVLRDAGLDASQLAVVGHALNGNALETYSAANLWRSLQLYGQSRGMGPSRSVTGGAQAVPVAMAASLPRPVRTGSRIARIEADTTGVTVVSTTGDRLRAAHAICALPFGALRRVALDAPLGEAQRDAIRGLPYTQIVQRHFRVTEPFWERDDLPADMWTDTPYERVFMQRGANGKPTGLGRCWINGSGAGAVDLSGFADAMAVIRPSMRGVIESLADVRWTDDDPFSGRAYMHFAPGQIARWAGVMGEPAGRLHFAGEHLGRLHTGMEAAMEAGERAAFVLMDGA